MFTYFIALLLVAGICFILGGAFEKARAEAYTIALLEDQLGATIFNESTDQIGWDWPGDLPEQDPHTNWGCDAATFKQAFNTPAWVNPPIVRREPLRLVTNGAPFDDVFGASFATDDGPSPAYYGD